MQHLWPIHVHLHIHFHLNWWAPNCEMTWVSQCWSNFCPSLPCKTLHKQWLSKQHHHRQVTVNWQCQKCCIKCKQQDVVDRCHLVIKFTSLPLTDEDGLQVKNASGWKSFMLWAVWLDFVKKKVLWSRWWRVVKSPSGVWKDGSLTPQPEGSTTHKKSDKKRRVCADLLWQQRCLERVGKCYALKLPPITVKWKLAPLKQEHISQPVTLSQINLGICDDKEMAGWEPQGWEPVSKTTS